MFSFILDYVLTHINEETYRKFKDRFDAIAWTILVEQQEEENGEQA